MTKKEAIQNVKSCGLLTTFEADYEGCLTVGAVQPCGCIHELLISHPDPEVIGTLNFDPCPKHFVDGGF